VTTVWRKAIRCRVIGDSVIPEGDIVFVPLEPSMVLRRGSDDLIEKGDDVVALGLGDADNLGDEAGIEEEGLPSGDRMCADEWVLGGDSITTDGPAEVSRALSLKFGGVDGGEAFEILLHEWRELVICSILRGPESITAAAARWASQDFERCVGWRLHFVCHLMMLIL
jgi:hypothetical protein